MPGESGNKAHIEDLRPIVIGTAGHVDHGKSTLVFALTGTDPDRLAEEKARSMTIDLGFASLRLPGGRMASIVDVPGHEHFIKNMLAGIGGIDLALLVVAADEGPMPQTREHLAIIDLLGIDRGVVAVTKTDHAGEDLTQYVVEEVGELLAGTSLAQAPVIPVSSVQRTGLNVLLKAIDNVATSASPLGATGPPRLPVDRVFSIAGFGTVVTGTMLGESSFSVGDELRIMPQGTRVRIRGLQSHGEDLKQVHAGMRAAINLSGIGVESIKRGCVVAQGSGLFASHRIDARLSLLHDAPVVLTQNARVDVFAGASEVQAQITLLESESLEPGNSEFVQFRLSAPIAVTVGDRLIVRQASPSSTIGGGAVLDANPVRHRRFDETVIGKLKALEAGNPIDLVLQSLDSMLRARSDVAKSVASITDIAAADLAIEHLIEKRRIVRLSAQGAETSEFLVTCSALDELTEKLTACVTAYHRDHPLRQGIPAEDLRAVLGITGRAFDAFMTRSVHEGLIALEGPLVRFTSFQVQLDPAAQLKVDAFLHALREHPLDPPSADAFGVDHLLLELLERQGEIVRISDTIVFDRSTHDMLIDRILTFLEMNEHISLAQFRDLVGTTRKYAQAVLEDFDRRRLTRRVSDVRYAGSAARSIVRMGKGSIDE